MVEKVSTDYYVISYAGLRSQQTITIEKDSEKLARGLYANSKIPG